METLGCQTYAVGGWSDGAIIGLLLTLQQPRCVSKLAIWGGNAYLATEDIAAYETTRSLSSWSPRMVDAMGAVYGDELQELWSRWCDGMLAIYCSGGELCRQRLHLIQCPTLILHGGKDPLVPTFHADVLEAGIAHSQLQMFPDGKHNIHTAFAQEFNLLLLEFLRS
jgi:valacyclovir hydrolase